MNRGETVDVGRANESGRRRKVIAFLKWIIAVAVLVGLIFASRSALDSWRFESERQVQQIRELNQSIASAEEPQQRRDLIKRKKLSEASVPRWNNIGWRWIALATFLYGLGLFPPALLLYRALRSLGEEPRLRTTIAAQLLGHMGKYVPGKAMVIILRSGALAKDGVGRIPATLSVFMETFLMMAVGATVAGAVTYWLPVPDWISLMAICAAVAATIPTSPPVLKLVAARVAKSRKTVGVMESVQLFVAGWVYSLLSWALIGASFTAIVIAIPSTSAVPEVGQLYAVATAAVSMGIVVGFASLLPGGAGVRELVLAAILGVHLGPAHALLAAIAARLLFIAVEVFLGGIAWLWLRRLGEFPTREVRHRIADRVSSRRSKLSQGSSAS